MNVILTFALLLASAIVIPALFWLVLEAPNRRKRRRMAEWDAWAKREKQRHLASMQAKSEVGDFDWDYAKKGRRL
jgi:peptidoglycan/LPS O-acetylase OafA/YrhL